MNPSHTDTVAPSDTNDPRGFLSTLNPLTLVVAIVPLWVGLLFRRDITVPLVVIGATLTLLFVGARLPKRTVLTLLIAPPLALAVMTVSFALWTNPAVAEGQWMVGAATSTRIGALVTLSLLGGLTVNGDALARALSAQARVPYRVSYAAVAASRFVPRFRAELQTIRLAHRVRRVGRFRAPFMAAIPLLASSIRHAERVAMTMDSRAFGAHPTRTERTPSFWRKRDTVVTIIFWILGTVILFAL